jgi:transposase
MKNVRFIGLDVHAETIAVAVAEAGGEVRSLGTIPNRPESVAAADQKARQARAAAGVLRGGPDRLRAVLAAERAGREVRGGRSDVGTGEGRRSGQDGPARCGEAGALLPGGDLTAVWVPDAAHEALRDLVRARLAAKRDQLRARNRLSKFLLRHGRRAPEGTTCVDFEVSGLGQAAIFEQAAQQATLMDYLHEVEHAGRAHRALWSARSIRRSRRCRRRCAR